MPTEEARRIREKRDAKRIKWSFALIILLSFGMVYGYSLLYQNSKADNSRDSILIAENAKRITEIQANNKAIQASRVASCRRTYAGIKEVFAPFIPKHPTNPRQVEVIETFNSNIERLKAGCIKQTKPKPRVKPKPEG